MLKLKIKIIIPGIIVIAILIFLFIYLNSVSQYKDEVAAITITDIDTTMIPDGTYEGECDVDFISVKVEVTVASGKIANIKLLKHKNGKGKPAEGIIDDIIQEQSLDVDDVSGATNSSKVIKKAILNALAKYINMED